MQIARRAGTLRKVIVSRILEQTARRLFESYPVLTLTGPRQSGKTTLCRAAFPELPYLSLEAPDTRDFALQDPRGLLARYPDGAILDEIQRAPDLASYLQEIVDEQPDRTGWFVLTGSQQLRVTEAVSQSLAGRTGVLRLLPFSMAEAAELGADPSIDAMLFHGFYPRIHDKKLEPTRALGDYFETYVERDVRQVSEIRNLSAFRTFVRLCAGRTGQLLNLTSLGNDAGVSHTTARDWISVLEASYILFRLEPLHANVSKRLIKSPKLYFHDVGLAAFLLGIEHPKQLLTHPLRGALFENLIVVEALKSRWNRGLRENMSFYRDSRGKEVDLVCSFADRRVGIEIKSGATVARDFLAGLHELSDQLPGGLDAGLLVYGGEQEFVREGVQVTHPGGFVDRLEAIERRLVG